MFSFKMSLKAQNGAVLAHSIPMISQVQISAMTQRKEKLFQWVDQDKTLLGQERLRPTLKNFVTPTITHASAYMYPPMKQILVQKKLFDGILDLNNLIIS